MGVSVPTVEAVTGRRSDDEMIHNQMLPVQKQVSQALTRPFHTLQSKAVQN